MELFEEFDDDRSDKVTRLEWCNFLVTDEAHACFAVLGPGITKFQSQAFFDMVDTDGSGNLELHKFIVACLHMTRITDYSVAGSQQACHERFESRLGVAQVGRFACRSA